MKLEVAKKAFANYVRKFDREDGKIRVKIEHIQKVVQNAGEIARGLNLSEEDVYLAELIGLLHDIGRFEQVKRYQTFVDQKSVNHAELGVQILWGEGLIREFITEDTYDEIIKQAILNHNIPKLPEKMENPRILLHSKIIRDADKIDIYRALIEEDIQSTYCCDSMAQDRIKEETVKDFKEKGYLDYCKLDNAAERMIAHIAYVFDVNYSASLKLIKQNNYLERLIHKYDLLEDSKNKIEECVKLAQKYIEEKTK